MWCLLIHIDDFLGVVKGNSKKQNNEILWLSAITVSEIFKRTTLILCFNLMLSYKIRYFWNFKASQCVGSACVQSYITVMNSLISLVLTYWMLVLLLYLYLVHTEACSPLQKLSDIEFTWTKPVILKLRTISQFHIVSAHAECVFKKSS